LKKGITENNVKYSVSQVSTFSVISCRLIYLHEYIYISTPYYEISASRVDTQP